MSRQAFASWVDPEIGVRQSRDPSGVDEEEFEFFARIAKERESGLSMQEIKLKLARGDCEVWWNSGRSWRGACSRIGIRRWRRKCRATLAREDVGTEAFSELFDLQMAAADDDLDGSTRAFSRGFKAEMARLEAAGAQREQPEEAVDLG